MSCIARYGIIQNELMKSPVPQPFQDINESQQQDSSTLASVQVMSPRVHDI